LKKLIYCITIAYHGAGNEMNDEWKSLQQLFGLSCATQKFGAVRVTSLKRCINFVLIPLYDTQRTNVS
jgi:hypothetical protein